MFPGAILASFHKEQVLWMPFKCKVFNVTKNVFMPEGFLFEF